VHLKYIHAFFLIFFGTVTAANASEPESTTATYGEWTVRCRIQGDENSSKICEMVQILRTGNPAQIVAQLAIGRPPGGDSLKLVVQLPIRVWLSQPVNLKISESVSIQGNYFQCQPSACLAEMDLDDAAVKSLEDSETLSLGFLGPDRGQISLDVSLRGFPDALSALVDGE
jgi:invasion protein IalB